MNNIIVLPKARIGIESALEYYDDISQELGDRFLDELDAVLEFLKTEPQIFQIKYD